MDSRSVGTTVNMSMKRVKGAHVPAVDAGNMTERVINESHQLVIRHECEK